MEFLTCADAEREKEGERERVGEAPNGDIGLFLKDKNICFMILFYDKTVLFG